MKVIQKEIAKPVVTLFAVTVLFISFMISSCLSLGSTDTVINRTGVYQFSNDQPESKIIVENQDGLVSFNFPEIVSFEESLLLRASIYQKWFLYFDASNNELWFHSSDIGLFLWRKESDRNTFTRVSILKSNRKEFNIPSKVIKNLPNSVLENWED